MPLSDKIRAYLQLEHEASSETIRADAVLPSDVQKALTSLTQKYRRVGSREIGLQLVVDGIRATRRVVQSAREEGLLGNDLVVAGLEEVRRQTEIILQKKEELSKQRSAPQKKPSGNAKNRAGRDPNSADILYEGDGGSR